MDDLTGYQLGQAWFFLLAQGEVPGATLADYLDAAYAYAKEQPETWEEAVQDEDERLFWRQAFS